MKTNEKMKLKQNDIDKYKGIKTYAFCLLVSLLFLLVCSSNSFLYTFNDWVDFNWYRTMGRGILDGKVIYRDLFDHKGPIIYFVFAFAELFSNPAVVIYFIECVTLSLFLFLSYKYLSKYLSYFYSLIGVVVLAFIIPCSILFNSGGGAVEEYMMPIFMYVFLTIDNYLSGQDFTRKTSIFIGVCIGLMFWIKFSTLVVSGILLITWFIMNLIKKKYKETFISILWMLVGFGVITLPVGIYFGVNNSLNYLWQSYFYDNIFRYDVGNGLINYLINFIGSSIIVYIGITLIFVALIALEIYLLKKNFKLFLLILPLFFQLLLFVLLKALPLTYYFLILVPYITLGVKALLSIIKKEPEKCKFRVLSISLVVAVLFGLTFITGNNSKDFGKQKEEYVQYQVVKDIESFELENPTLFCYSMWDYGFYNALGVVPTERFYARNNFSRKAYPEMYETFDNAIKNATADFVIVIKSDYEENQSMFDNKYNFVNDYKALIYENDINYIEEEFILLIKK